MQTQNPAVVLITGCSSGIGRALAEAFHAEGCTVWATARNADALTALAEQGMSTRRLDVADAASIAEVVAEIEATHGAVDILVNNAGMPSMGPVAEVPLDELRQLWEVNITGVVAMTQAVVPAMMQRRAGRIINIGSVSGVLTTPFAGPYCASKAAVRALSEALSMELRPFGIEVIEVQPGGIESGFGTRALNQVGQQQWRLYADYEEAIRRRAGASQENATPAAEFAASLVRQVRVARPAPRLRIGAGSRMLPLLAKLPRRLRERILARRFGLDG